MKCMSCLGLVVRLNSFGGLIWLTGKITNYNYNILPTLPIGINIIGFSIDIISDLGFTFISYLYPLYNSFKGD